MTSGTIEAGIDVCAESNITSSEFVRGLTDTVQGVEPDLLSNQCTFRPQVVTTVAVEPQVDFTVGSISQVEPQRESLPLPQAELQREGPTHQVMVPLKRTLDTFREEMEKQGPGWFPTGLHPTFPVSNLGLGF